MAILKIYRLWYLWHIFCQYLILRIWPVWTKRTVCLWRLPSVGCSVFPREPCTFLLVYWGVSDDFYNHILCTAIFFSLIHPLVQISPSALPPFCTWKRHPHATPSHLDIHQVIQFIAFFVFTCFFFSINDVSAWIEVQSLLNVLFLIQIQML